MIRTDCLDWQTCNTVSNAKTPVFTPARTWNSWLNNSSSLPAGEQHNTNYTTIMKHSM